MNRKSIVFLSVFVLGIVLDQLSKLWVRGNLTVGVRSEEITVIPGLLDIVHAENRGAAFGFMSGFEYRQIVFLIFTVVAIGVIVDLFRKLPSRDWFVSLTLGLILSGAIGNAIDRITMSKVTDFIKVHAEFWPTLSDWLLRRLSTNEWPTFNVADMSLVVGVLLFLVHYLFLEEKDEPATAESQPPAPKAADDAKAERSETA